MYVDIEINVFLCSEKLVGIGPWPEISVGATEPLAVPPVASWTNNGG
jgi:hypothetical protein